MPDVDKVIKGVHDARRYFEDREWVDKSVGVHIDALNDAIAMLKEQEDLGTELTNAVELIHKKNERIEKLLKEQEIQKFFVDESGKITPLPVVVRCKDCKFGSPISERGLDFIFCHFRENKHQYATHGGCFEPDWFCADGERR